MAPHGTCRAAWLAVAWLAATQVLAPSSWAQDDAVQVYRDEQIEAELLSEAAVLAPGATTWLALRLAPAEHWHTYWKMGGDSGEPTAISDWDVPAGTVIGDMLWPAPYWLPFYDTGLVNFGYEQEVLHPLPVTLPADYAADEVTLTATAYWNVCEQICIPGEQRLTITLSVAAAVALDPVAAARFALTRERLPREDHGIESFIAMAGERVSLAFRQIQEVAAAPIFAGVTDAWFFPDQRRIIKPGPRRDVSIQGDYLQITHQQPRRMLADPQPRGVLVTVDAAGNRQGYAFSAPARLAEDATFAGLAPLSGGGGGGSPAGGGGGSPAGGGGLFLYMAFALLGGMILNLMPCVFPVLSIKALALARNASAAASRQRLDGLAYTAGVIAAFLLLATLLIALRAGGERIGWAFQFQQPWFLAFIVYLFFVLGLSLSGVFTIGTSLMGAGSGLAERKGYQGSFFTGVLATTVATPCTAPFMGPALGFALTQPWLVAMPVFIALGFGMALPILLLSFVPVLSAYLPKPGPWMETFKQLMAFPLYASALFFLWALGNQVGVMGMTAVLGSCVALAFAAWLHAHRRGAGPAWRTVSFATSLGAFALAVWVLQTPFLQAGRPGTALAAADGGATGGANRLAGRPAEAGAGYELFSAARVAELRQAGRPVFVNMTADWCITCLANEQTSLGTERVRQAMAQYDVTYMKGDWTNEDPAITAVLEEFNRPSVPLYILYPGDPAAAPRLLPQLLTPGILIEAFAAAAAGGA